VSPAGCLDRLKLSGSRCDACGPDHQPAEMPASASAIARKVLAAITSHADPHGRQKVRVSSDLLCTDVARASARPSVPRRLDERNRHSATFYLIRRPSSVFQLGLPDDVIDGSIARRLDPAGTEPGPPTPFGHQSQ